MVNVLRLALSAACALALTGFGPATEKASQTGSQRTFSWFSYLDGSSLRRDCAQSEADSYRLVYNADFTEQVRTYDLVVPRGTTSQGSPASGRPYALLKSHVFTYGPLVQIGGAIVGSYEASIWAQRTVPIAAVTPILAALEKSGFGAAGDGTDARPASGELRSDSYYWLVSGCVDRKFRISAWSNLDAEFSSVAFAPKILALDETAIPIRLPQPATGGLGKGNSDGTGPGLVFEVQVTPNGIRPSWQ